MRSLKSGNQNSRTSKGVAKMRRQSLFLSKVALFSLAIVLCSDPTAAWAAKKEKSFDLAAFWAAKKEKKENEAKKEKKQNPTPAQTPPVAPRETPDIPDPAVAEVYRELQNIIDLHKTLQVQHQTQIAQIQKITSQARAHQKILQTLDAVKRVPPAAGRGGVEEMVRQEKIRQIQRQTEVNRAALEGIRTQTTVETLKAVAQEEEARAKIEEEKKKTGGKGPTEVILVEGEASEEESL